SWSEKITRPALRPLRIDDSAARSFARARAPQKLGSAIATRMPMMSTTTINSMRVKPSSSCSGVRIRTAPFRSSDAIGDAEGFLYAYPVGRTGYRQIPHAGGRSAPLLQVVAQLLGATGVAELGQRLGLDLADPLSRDAELLAPLCEGSRMTVDQAEPQLDHFLLALRERMQHALE